MTVARSRPPLEKVEQHQIVNLVRTMGGRVWVLGTRRRRGDHQGTMQTPGLPDLWIVLPRVHGALNESRDQATLSHGGEGLWWEVKRNGGRRSPDQVDFADACALTGIGYGYGTLDDFIARMVAEGRLRSDRLPHYRSAAQP